MNIEILKFKVDIILKKINIYLTQKLSYSVNAPITTANIGLFGGMWGMILFVLLYNIVYNNKNTSSSYIDYSLDIISSGNIGFSFANGLSGILYIIDLLNKRNVVDIEISEVRRSLMDDMLKIMEKHYNLGNYDFLHGASGISFLYKNEQLCCKKTIESLKKIITIKDQRDNTILRQDGIIDISLSHGISAMTAILSILYNIKPNKNLEEIITSFNCYIMNQELEVDKYKAMFPSLNKQYAIINNAPDSRLSWCYGDLGIASSLWISGKFLSNQKWMNKANLIMENSLHRKSLNINFVKDTCVCHGTAGIAMMFYYWAKETRCSKYYDCYLYWIKKTVEIIESEIGLKYYNPVTNKYVDRYSLLEGVAGVGLVLLTLLNSDTDFWMESLLLF